MDMVSEHDDARFMRLAITLGRRGLGNTWPNPAVGVVIVKDGVLCGRGWTQPGGRPHAETEAIRRAGEATREATLYTTLEPCSHHGKTPPCVDAIVAAGIGRVVSAIEDPNPQVAGQGHARLSDAGIRIDTGLYADVARRDHNGHIRRISDGRPHVTLKLALSADGKVAAADRKRAAITSDSANAYVHRLRAMHDAILVGIGTVLADDPLLTCRLPGLEHRSPVRVILDRTLRIEPSSRLVQTAHITPVWVLTSSDAHARREKEMAQRGVEILSVDTCGDVSALSSALGLLARRGITRVLVEGGPIVAQAFVSEGLVDELVILRGPGKIGADGIDAPAVLTAGAPDIPGFSLLETDMLGPDWLHVYGRA